ncbi:putative capsid protein [Pacific flying fox faeces associated circular DNA virus-5]|nr:putative capsid protein [Pacific flying fox faeces associated circular DNA virus-5]
MGWRRYHRHSRRKYHKARQAYDNFAFFIPHSVIYLALQGNRFPGGGEPIPYYPRVYGNILNFTEPYIGISVTQGAPQLFYFQLNDIPNYLQFTGLYDQYRISRITASFFPSHTSQPINNSAYMKTDGTWHQTSDPDAVTEQYTTGVSSHSDSGTYYNTFGDFMMTCWVDVDGTNSSLTQSSYQNVTQLHKWRWTEKHEFTFWPKPYLVSANVGGTTGPAPDLWQDCSDVDIQYWGLWVQALPQLPTGQLYNQTQQYDTTNIMLYCTYHVEFRFRQ